VFLFKNRLNIVADYYNRLAKDIIYNTPIPSVTGFTNVTTNLASLKNNGCELAVNYSENINKLRFSVGANAAYNKNKLLYINPELNSTNDRVVNGDHALLRGEPIDAIYGLKVTGIFQSQEEIDKSPTQFTGTAPGDLKYEDISGPNGKADGVIDGYDRQVLGKETPTWTYGFNASIDWKHLTLTAQFQGIGDVQSYGFFEYFVPTFQGSNIAEMWLNRWTPENPSTTMPRLWNTSGPNTQFTNSFFVQDRSFLRLKNVTLQYDLSSIVKKTFLSGLRVYVSGQNLFTWTKFKGFDPEKSYQLGRSGIPQVKLYTAGINVSF